MAKGTDPEGFPGPGVDAAGQPVVDPTANVLQLVEAAIRRQDDLRTVESRHIREIMTLRATCNDELRDAETARIDAIRAVDVQAVQRAAEVSAAAAQTLATQVTTSAETLRTQVAAAAQASTVALSAALEPIQKDVAELRKVQYEQQGQKAANVETKGDTAASSTRAFAILGACLVAAGLFVSIAAVVVTLILANNP